MMLRGFILMTTAACCFAVAPALAQHPHGGGASGSAGGSHGPAMSDGAADHGVNASKGVASSSPTTQLTNNSKLDATLTSKLQSKGLIPAGSDLKDVCSGFKNLGQCIAAIHVSHNHEGISFACLKADMTGMAPTTGTTCPAGTGASKMSLGKSIQTLSPNTDSKEAVKTAQQQSDADIKDSQTQP
jgi:hypothetical protein